jgi:hypothetical protein
MRMPVTLTWRLLAMMTACGPRMPSSPSRLRTLLPSMVPLPAMPAVVGIDDVDEGERPLGVGGVVVVDGAQAGAVTAEVGPCVRSGW